MHNIFDLQKPPLIYLERKYHLNFLAALKFQNLLFITKARKYENTKHTPSASLRALLLLEGI